MEDLSLTTQLPIQLELVERRIYMFRGQKVMLDFDLAELYQVITKNLNLAVRRNMARFPKDFMFQLTSQETESLRLQFATSNIGRGGRRYLPYAFTEQGVSMLSAVLKSLKAVRMSIVIIRAFVQLRQMLATHKDLAAKMEKLETTQKDQGLLLALLANDIKKLGPDDGVRKLKIGFRTD